jgi:hypothetical protein
MREKIFHHPFRFINHPESTIHPVRSFVEVSRVIEEPIPEGMNVRIPDDIISPVWRIKDLPISVGVVLQVGRIRISRLL